MLTKISSEAIRARIARDNPWWSSETYTVPESTHPRRVYFKPFKDLALNVNVKRATVLLGPRRVGKTFMIKQLIHEGLQTGIKRPNVMYVSIDTPIYSGISLEGFLEYLPHKSEERNLVIFDEIQYLKDWEIHLKDLVDQYPNIKFIASGSAAAALQLKSKESGAGRFSDFMLPPLTFYEFLMFLGEDEKYIEPKPESLDFIIKDIDGLNERFIDYLNYGGYPEAAVNEDIRQNPEQFIKNDIIDKVLLKDLPSLYGINKIQDLNKLFAVLAFNAGNEASLDNISAESGVPKPTITKYIEYLESAFLIIKVSTLDNNCKTMKRERNFKVYLNNPSMRAALFEPVKSDDSAMIGRLTESAIFSQWQHSPSFRNIHYARWKNEGEVDIVSLNGEQKPIWIGEIKWSDRAGKHWSEDSRHLSTLIKKHKSITGAIFTTKTLEEQKTIGDVKVDLRPSAAHCYIVGRNITTSINDPQQFALRIAKKV